MELDHKVADLLAALGVDASAVPQARAPKRQDTAIL